jgi:osmotically-inducible protein OsmY
MKHRRPILGLATALALFAIPAVSWAANPPPRPPPLDLADPDPYHPPQSALGLIRDMRLRILAQRMLEADRVLAPLKLKVEVHSAVAVISGTIPSEEVGRDAIGKLETIKGIEEVRARFQRSASVLKPADVGMHVEVAKHASANAARNEKGEDTVLSGPRTSAVKQGATAGAGVGRPPSLTEQVAQARKSDGRFAAINVDVQDGMLVVHRSGVSSADATALAEKLRRIPGVGEVLIASD